MKPADVFLAVLVAVTWGVALVGEAFGPLRLAGMITVVGGIAIMLLSKRLPAVPAAA
jgi:drug/metabolite transporter (DMT)-like permease